MSDHFSRMKIAIASLLILLPTLASAEEPRIKIVKSSKLNIAITGLAGGDLETLRRDLVNSGYFAVTAADQAQFTANAAVGAAGATITESTVDLAETALFNAKVAAIDPKYLVVDGATYSQLRQIPRFSEYQTAGEAGLRALVDGSVGKIKDFYVFRSQFVQKTGSGPATTQNLAFTKSAIGLVTRRLPQPLLGTGAIAEYAEAGNFGVRVLMSYAPNTLAQQFTVDVLYGAAVLRNTHAVQVRS